MARRSFIFCDICNPLAIRDVEMRRGTGRITKGRRVTDGRVWFDGSEDDARNEGWVATDDGRHICPACFERMRSMRHILEENSFLVPNMTGAVEDSID